MSPTLSAAVTGYVETTDRSIGEKNRLIPPNPYSDTPFDFLRAVVMGLHAEVRWAAEPDVQAWLDGSRLNVVKGLGSTGDDPRCPTCRAASSRRSSRHWRSSVPSGPPRAPASRSSCSTPTTTQRCVASNHWNILVVITEVF